MITKEQKETIVDLARCWAQAESAVAWEYSSWSSSRSAKKQAEEESAEAEADLEQYLDGIMA